MIAVSPRLEEVVRALSARRALNLIRPGPNIRRAAARPA
jgi:hypothetical protein